MPYEETYAYCLLGNHFHILIRVRDESDIKPSPTLQKVGKVDHPAKSIHEIVSHQFRKLFQSYALAFNKQHNRIGTLFQKPFKRALVDSDSYLNRLILYIHLNPQRHNLVKEFKEWPWSSYHTLVSEKHTDLCRQEVLDWFGDTKELVKLHEENGDDLKDHLKIDD